MNMSRRALERKLENLHRAVLKVSLEKTFWQRKCKYYAPNRMNDHYKELDNELKKEGLYTHPSSEYEEE